MGIEEKGICNNCGGALVATVYNNEWTRSRTVKCTKCGQSGTTEQILEFDELIKSRVLNTK